MAWTRTRGHVVLTHDLDFDALLAASDDAAPSVIQIRAQDVTPGHLENILVVALRRHEPALADGALVSIDEARSRVRILPLKRRASL